MVSSFQHDVLASITPLVSTAVAQLVGEVVVVEVNTPHVTVCILVICITIHENFHGFTAVLQQCDEQYTGDRNHHHENLYTCTQQWVEQELEIFPCGHRLETMLLVEMAFRVHCRIVDAANNPWCSVEWASDRV